MWNVVLAWIQPGFCWSEAILISTFLVPFTGFFELKSYCRLGRFLEKDTFVPRTRLLNSCVLFGQVASKRGRKHRSFCLKGTGYSIREVRDVQDATCRMMHPSFRVPCYTRIYAGHIMTHHDASLLCDFFSEKKSKVYDRHLIHGRMRMTMAEGITK